MLNYFRLILKEYLYNFCYRTELKSQKASNISKLNAMAIQLIQS